MATAIISDIHANIEALLEVERDINEHNILLPYWREISSEGNRQLEKRLRQIKEKESTGKITEEEAKKYAASVERFYLNGFSQEELTEIYILGDVVGYGPDSAKTLDKIIEWHVEGILRGIVRGNHEEFLIWMMQEMSETGIDPDETFYKLFASQVHDRILKEQGISARIDPYVFKAIHHSIKDAFTVNGKCLTVTELEALNETFTTAYIEAYDKSPTFFDKISNDELKFFNVLYKNRNFFKKNIPSAEKMAEITEDQFRALMRWKLLTGLKYEIIDGNTLYKHTNPAQETNTEVYVYPTTSLTTGEKTEAKQKNPTMFKTATEAAQDAAKRHTDVQVVFLGHSHRDSITEIPPVGNERQCNGKIHIKSGFSYIIVTPSAGFPRGQAKAGYNIYDGEKVQTQYITFDMKQVSAKMQTAGLTPRFDL